MRRSIVILALGAFCSSASAASPPPPVLIRADKIYTAPDAQPLLHGTVLLSGGQISAVADQHSRLRVPPGTRSSDCQGVVVAGFQNSHVHFTERKFENAAVGNFLTITHRHEGQLVLRRFVDEHGGDDQRAEVISLSRLVDTDAFNGR